MRVLILAAVNPDNTPNGYYWTFLFPMLLFIAVAAVLYLLFSRPHRRIPARGISLPGSAAGSLSPAMGAAALATGPAPYAEPGSAAEPESGEGEQAEGDAASAGDAESGE